MKKILLSLVAVLFATSAMADYSINFKDGQGDWTINDVTMPEGATYVWSQTSTYGMKASAYINKTNCAAESWLISPAIELKKTAGASAITLKFNQAGKYFGTAAEEATAWVSTDKTNWTQLTFSTILDGSSWSYVETTCDLSAQEGKTVYVAFKYLSSTTAAPTWEISDVAIEGIEYSTEPTVDISNTPETAYTVTEALALITAGEGLSTSVYVKGTVLPDDLSISTSYGNATYYISDGTNNIQVYRGYYLENTKFTSEDQLQDGDEVIVYGQLTSYNGTSEIGSGNYIYSKNGKTHEDVAPYTLTGDGSFENPYTAADVQNLYADTENTPTESVWVKGTILGNVNTSTGATQVPTVFTDVNGDGVIDKNDCGDDDILAVATNISLGDETASIAVQLPSGDIRSAVNVLDNPDNMNKTVWLYGVIQKYCTVAGLKSVTDCSFDGVTGINTVSANENANETVYNVAGQRVNNNFKGIVIKNGKKFMK